MTSLTAQCASTFEIIVKVVVTDAQWKAFGYKRMPRRARLFQRFVLPATLERETTLLRELWAIGFSTVLRWALERHDFQYRKQFIARLMEFLIDGLGEPLWPIWRFPTRRDAINFLRNSCSDYSHVESGERGSVFLGRCSSSMTQEIPKLWVVGAAFVLGHPATLVSAIEPALNAAGIAHNPDCDIVLADAEYLSIAAGLLGSA